MTSLSVAAMTLCASGGFAAANGGDPTVVYAEVGGDDALRRDDPTACDQQVKHSICYTESGLAQQIRPPRGDARIRSGRRRPQLVVFVVFDQLLRFARVFETILQQRRDVRRRVGRAPLQPSADCFSERLGGLQPTHLDFCYVRPGDDPRRAMEERVDRWRGQSSIDYSFHVGLTGKHSPTAFQHIPELIERGFPSFKFFTSTVLPPTPGRPGLAGFGRIAEIIRRASAAGGILTVHAEDDEIVQYNYARFREEGRTEARHMPLVHSTLSERMAFRRVLLHRRGVVDDNGASPSG
jgi:hypothetical protein